MSDFSTRRGFPGLVYPEAYLARLAEELSARFTGILCSLESDCVVTGPCPPLPARNGCHLGQVDASPAMSSSFPGITSGSAAGSKAPPVQATVVNRDPSGEPNAITR